MSTFSILVVRNFCEEANVLKAIRIVSALISIIKVLVPVVLVITGMISLARVVIAGEETKDAVRTLITKIIIGFVIFLVPTIVYALMGFISGYNNNESKYHNCITCLRSVSECNSIMPSD